MNWCQTAIFTILMGLPSGLLAQSQNSTLPVPGDSKPIGEESAVPETVVQKLSGELPAGPSPDRIRVLSLSGVINPVSAEFITRSIHSAETSGEVCLIIQLDTPGGLMESMRSVIKAILGAGIPVVVYVAPSGARAASAGVFITLAAHFAAMAPGTNIGAAHPVMIGDHPRGASDTSKTMLEKVTNDAVAYIQSIAEKRHRNVEWARQAVLESTSSTALEALELGVIDTVVNDIQELCRYLDGKRTEVASGEIILQTRDTELEFIRMSLRYRILDRIADPNIAYLLFLLGLYGIFFELSNPGAVFPGVVGIIFLILAFFAFQVLPINYAGLALIVLSIILLLLEIKVTSYGLLSIGGALSLLLGSLMLFESTEPLMRVSLGVIIPAVIFTLVFFLVAVGFALKAQRRTPVTGNAGMVGSTGKSLSVISTTGKVLVKGEIWNAVSATRIPKNAPVKVVAVQGMKLQVEPAWQESQDPVT